MIGNTFLKEQYVAHRYDNLRTGGELLRGVCGAWSSAVHYQPPPSEDHDKTSVHGCALGEGVVPDGRGICVQSSLAEVRGDGLSRLCNSSGRSDA